MVAFGWATWQHVVGHHPNQSNSPTTMQSGPDTCQVVVGPFFFLNFQPIRRGHVAACQWPKIHSQLSFFLKSLSVWENEQNTFPGACDVGFLRNELCRIQNDEIYTIVQVPHHSDNYHF